MKLVKRTRLNALYHLLRNMTVAAQGKNLNNSVQKGRVTWSNPKGTILIWCEDQKLCYRYYPPDQTVALKPGDTVTFEVADGKAVAVKRP